MAKNKVRCINCGSLEAFIATDYRYHGLRGTCHNCDSNWPES